MASRNRYSQGIICYSFGLTYGLSNPDVPYQRMDSKTSTQSTVSIAISKELYDKVENRVKLSNGEFKTAEEYIAFLINEVVNDAEQSSSEGNAYTAEEEEEIKGRLKNLGYI